MKGVKVQIKQKEEQGILREGSYKVQPINWVGNKKSKKKPMTERSVKNVLDHYNTPKYVKVGVALYKVTHLQQTKEGISFRLVKEQDPEKLAKSLKGWYNVADESGKYKIGVYNLTRSMREGIARENNIEHPNKIQFLIKV